MTAWLKGRKKNYAQIPSLPKGRNDLLIEKVKMILIVFGLLAVQ